MATKAAAPAPAPKPPAPKPVVKKKEPINGFTVEPLVYTKPAPRPEFKPVGPMILSGLVRTDQPGYAVCTMVVENGKIVETKMGTSMADSHWAAREHVLWCGKLARVVRKEVPWEKVK